MSFLSTKDFADLVGVKPSTLRVHIRREKVVKTGKLIDTEHPTNVIYINEQKTNTPVTSESEKPPKKTKPSEVKSKFQPPEKEESAAAGEIAMLTIKKKQADLLKVQKDAEYKQLQILKLNGKLMPLDLVQKTQTINIQSVFRAFESAAENIASIYNERLGGDRADLADMITRMRQELDRSVESAKEKSKAEIEALIDEYSETLNRGQSK